MPKNSPSRTRRWLSPGSLAIHLSFVPLVLAAASERPLFDIPKIDGITVDGKADDWGEKGFQVRSFYPRSGKVLPASDFAPLARIGWNDDGLLFLVTVRDDKAVESPGSQPYNFDSVEIFAAAGPELRERLQLILTPGRDKEIEGAGKVSTTVEDRRATTTTPIASKSAATSDADSYTIETLIPWSAFHVAAPESGMRIAANLQVNDRDRRLGGNRHETTWFTTGWAGKGPEAMHALRLAETASAPDGIVAGSRQGVALQTLRILAIGTPEDEGAEIIVTQAGEAISTERLVLEGDFAIARFEIPLDASSPAAPMAYDVRVGDRWLHTNEVEDVAAKRRELVEQARLHVHPIFNSDGFPSVEFETPGWIEAMLGEYSISTDYYDAGYAPVDSATKPGRYGAVTTVEAEGIEPIMRYTTLFRLPTDEEVDWNDMRIGSVQLPGGLGLEIENEKQQSAAVNRFLDYALADDFSHEETGALLLSALYETEQGAKPLALAMDPWSRDGKWWIGLRKKLGLFKHRYHVDLPDGYDAPENADRRWPTILFLHGAGERGSDENPVPRHGPSKVIRDGTLLPFLVISPQCERGEWWTDVRVEDCLDEIVGKFRVDADRIYLTGLSMGGYGSWSTAQALPGRFAAVAPICGGGDPSAADRLVDLPIWNFHGDADPKVPIARSRKMVEAIREAGGESVAFTVYPGVDHDSWTATYKNPKLYEWFLANKRGEPPVMPAPGEVTPP